MQPANKLTILVTGTNRGLGKALAIHLLENLPESTFIFTSRKDEAQVKKECSELDTKYADRNFKLMRLDLTCEKSIQDFVQQVKNQKYTFDAIINNAAMGYDVGTEVPQPTWAKALLYSNVVDIGVIRLTNSLLPYLKENGRVINVSSKLGALNLHSKEVVDEFSDPEIEEQQIFTAVEEYVALCVQGDLKKWYKSAYATSKMMLNAWSRFVIKRKLKQGQISIAMSPGHCLTDMGGENAAHSAESGAKAIYDCIFMENPSYDVFYHRWTKSDYTTCGPQHD